MSTVKDQGKSAEVVERLLRKTAIAMALLSLSFFWSAFEHTAVLAENLDGYLLAGRMVLRGSVILVLAPSFVGFLRLKLSGRLASPDENYVVSVYQRAASLSFASTFVGLVLTEVAARHWWVQEPRLYLSLILGLSVGVFSVFFLREMALDDEGDH